jgi:hypothetical protein
VIDGRNIKRGVSTVQAVHVAWDRARAFSLVSLRYPVLAGFIAPWLWPVHLAVVGGQGDQIRSLGGASLAACDGERHRVHLPTLAVAVVAVLAQFVLIVLACVALAIALLPLLSPALAGVSALLVAISPLVLEGPVSAVVRLARHRESLTLNRRRREFAQVGPASVMSSLVRSKGSVAGAGKVLLAAMKCEWRENQSVVIFYPASESLIAYYRREGAVIDDGARRRMKFDFRHLEPSLQTAGDAAGAHPVEDFHPVRRLQRDLRAWRP